MEGFKILILGGTGMLGSMVTAFLYDQGYNVTFTSRNPNPKSKIPCIYFDAKKFDVNRFKAQEYDLIINCIGAIKQKHNSPEDYYILNSVFPWKIAALCKLQCVKFIHVSSDCVWNGKLNIPNKYKITSATDATDDYGISKAHGEPLEAITLRTSIIGPHNTEHGLFEWLRRSKKTQVSGYTNHHWSGVTTLELSRIIHYIIQNKLFVNKVSLVASNSLTKFELLNKINETFELKKEISEVVNVEEINRTFIDSLGIKLRYYDIDSQLKDLKEWMPKYNDLCKNIYNTL